MSTAKQVVRFCDLKPLSPGPEGGGGDGAAGNAAEGDAELLREWGCTSHGWLFRCPCGSAIIMTPQDGVAPQNSTSSDVGGDLGEEAEEKRREQREWGMKRVLRCRSCTWSIQVELTDNEAGICAFYAGKFDRAVEAYERAYRSGELTGEEARFNIWESLEAKSRRVLGEEEGLVETFRRIFKGDEDQAAVEAAVQNFWFEKERRDREKEERRARAGLTANAIEKKIRAKKKKLRKIEHLQRQLQEDVAKKLSINEDQRIMLTKQESLQREVADLEGLL